MIDEKILIKRLQDCVAASDNSNFTNGLLAAIDIVKQQKVKKGGKGKKVKKSVKRLAEYCTEKSCGNCIFQEFKYQTNNQRCPVLALRVVAEREGMIRQKCTEEEDEWDGYDIIAGTKENPIDFGSSGVWKD